MSVVVHTTTVGGKAMKTMVLLLALFVIGFSEAQVNAQPPCYPAYQSNYYSMPQLASLPPLSGGMSYDEILGYIALDSICRQVEVSQIDSFMQARLSWDDTVRYMYKYMTTVVDGNPLLVFGINHSVSEWRLSFPDEIRMYLSQAIAKHSPHPNLDLAIARSDYILIVTINDTANVVDTSAKFARTSIIASCDVTDTILGHRIPACSTIPLIQFSSGSSLGCAVFDVRREQVGNCREQLGLDAADTAIDHSLPQPSQQYLVFLKLVRLCTDSSNLYYTLIPVYSVGSRCGIFKIHGGRFSDELNYFNLGSNPLLADVKAEIEARILQVKEWVP